jgi:ornithine carbamoyltransferase
MTGGLTAPGDLLRVADLSAGQLHALLDLADAMRDRPASWTRLHPRTAIACIFEQPSMRTRVSFEVAAHRLGILAIVLDPDDLAAGRGAPLPDTARQLSSYTEAIVVRTRAQTTLVEVADAAAVPVINGLTDAHNPCQALADLLTLRRRFGTLEGLRLAYLGDGDNVAHSLMEAGALAGMEVVVASPAGHEPDRDVTALATTLAELHGGSVRVGRDPRAAVVDADAVYAGVWSSTGRQPGRERRPTAVRSYRVDAALMRLTSPRAAFMQGRPAPLGDDVADDLTGGPASAVWEQSANRLPTEQALLHAILTRNWEG